MSGCPLNMPAGMVLEHAGVRIAFAEAVDGMVLRFVRCDDGNEYFPTSVDSVGVRFTVRALLDEFHAGRLRDITAGEAALTEWRGRFLGLDRATVFAKEPRAVRKYDVALAALVARLPKNAEILKEFAANYYDEPDQAPSGRSMIRWMANLIEHGERVGAMKNRSGREKGRSQLPPIMDRIVHQSVAIFWSPKSIRKMDGHALVVHAWRQLKAAGVKGIGHAPPSKTAVVNRINACETLATKTIRDGRYEAVRHFAAAGETVPVTRPFDLIQFDGVEFEQICHFSREVRIPSNKMKAVYAIDAAIKFVFPSTPFAGPYRSEMGMKALLGVLTPPPLDEDTKEKHPERVLFFGRIVQARFDNDKAIIPPASIGNLANVIARIELAKSFGPDEKPDVENFNGFLMRRMAEYPGTVLSARSRRRSIRRDLLAEASRTRAEYARHYEELRLEWNDTGHEANGGRTPNEMMLEHVMAEKVRFTPAGEIERNLARTVPAVITTDGVFFDGIRYKWNRTGVTKLLSENIAAQHFATRLEGTARCAVTIKVFDWDLDRIEVLNDSNNEFVPLWSEDPAYTLFLNRYEHNFHQLCVRSGDTGAQTAEDKANRRAEGMLRAWSDLEGGPYKIAKVAAAVLECVEVRERAKNVKDDPDFGDFSKLLMLTDVGGAERNDVPFGPSMTRIKPELRPPAADPAGAVVPDYGGLEEGFRSNQQMLEADRDEGPRRRDRLAQRRHVGRRPRRS